MEQPRLSAKHLDKSDVPVIDGIPRGLFDPSAALFHGNVPRPDARSQPEWEAEASQIQIFARDLDIEKAANKNLRSWNADLKTETNKLRSDNEALQQRISNEADRSSKVQIAQLDDTAYEKLKSEHLALQRRFDDVSLQHSAMQTEIISLRAQLEDARAAKEKVDSELETTRAQVEYIMGERNTARRNAMSSAQEAKDWKRQLKNEVQSKHLLCAIAYKHSAKLEPFLKGRTILDLDSREMWSIVGWLDDMLVHLYHWLASGGAVAMEAEPDSGADEFPFNLNPKPGPEPTTYDLKYGSIILERCRQMGTRLEKYKPLPPAVMPEIPNSGTMSYQDVERMFPYAVNQGNTDWTTGWTALESIDTTMPSFKWFSNEDGIPIMRYDTPSRTRSRTLESWQELPDDAKFFDVKDPTMVSMMMNETGFGSAWTDYSLSEEHKGRTYILPFIRRYCVCDSSRTAGNCRPHDFRVEAESSQETPKSIRRRVE